MKMREDNLSKEAYENDFSSLKMLRHVLKSLHSRAESRQTRCQGRSVFSNPTHLFAMLLLAMNPKATFKPSGLDIPHHLPALRPRNLYQQGCFCHENLAARRWVARVGSPVMQYEPFEPMLPYVRRQDVVAERTIWGFWGQGYDDMSDMFKLCIDTWQRHNPDWDVRILDSKTVYDYVSPEELPNIFEEMTSYQTQSDAVRLALLCRYGGIWLDVNVLIRCNLDKLCWSDIQSGNKSAAVFYHSHYGTEAFKYKDMTESWFLATKPGNPFFIKWRDTFLELLRDRKDIYGISEHPLYTGVDLYGIDKLNGECGIAGFNMKDYLAIHSMGIRLLQTEPELQKQWRDTFIKIDAAETAFKLQLYFQEVGETVGFAILTHHIPSYEFMANVPLLKFNSDHYQMAIHCAGDQLESSTIMGELMYDCIEYQDPESSEKL